MAGFPTDPEEAAELFVKTVISEVYNGTDEDILSALRAGPPGRRPDQDSISIHLWFRDLDDVDKEHVAAIVRECVDAATFHFLVLLDGMTGGYPIPGKESDFALYLREYENAHARAVDSPLASIRLNPAGVSVEDLHDIFRRLLQERAEGNPTS